MNLHSIRINRGGVLILVVVAVVVIYLYSSSSNDTTTIAYVSMLRNSNPDSVNLKKLLIRSIQAAQNGGYEITDVSDGRQLNLKSKGKTKEGADDLVTDADGRSHCVMKSSIRNTFPLIKIISEEDPGNTICNSDAGLFDLDPTVLHGDENLIGDDFVNTNDVTVWIDPLDATQEFTEKLYKYVTTMVCVAVKGIPIIGVIHNPFSGKTTWAYVGKGVSTDLAQIQKKIYVNRQVVTISRSHAGDVQALTKSVFGNNTKIIEAAGAGYKVLLVAFNNATAYLHSTNIKKWDICAGNAIINSLGGRMTTLLNEDIDYSSQGSPVNDKGLLSTLFNHDVYIQKLAEYIKANE